MDTIVIDKVWLTETAVWIRTVDGKEACENFNEYPRLKYATPEQRSHYTLSAEGIHWEELDEDLCFDGFFHEKKQNPLYQLFITHPELNASAIARRLGLSQSLFAQYISGSKKPSKERLEEILETIRSIRRDPANIHVA